LAGAIPHFAKAITPRIEELGLGRAKLGLVGLSGLYGEYGGFPHATYAQLTASFPNATFEDATDIVDELKKVKSDEEIRCLEYGVAVMEKVFVAIEDTADVGVEDREIRGAIMDTLWRNGCEPGSMILYCQGRDVMHGGQSGGWFAPPTNAPLNKGDVILIELDATYLGYKAQFNHAWSMGEPDDEWRSVFDCAAQAYARGLEVLRPGATVGDLEEAMLQPLRDGGFKWGNPPFHGLGLGLEAPMGNYPRVNYKGADPDEEFQANMVMEFEPHPATADLGRAASVGGPILVTTDGCRELADWWSPDPIIL
jgi:Xaa-Pro aminopeptidase